jgi:hypothetical protein
MNDEKTVLNVTDEKGEKRVISISDVISLGIQIGTNVANTGGISYAAGMYEAMLLRCHSGNIVVPRTADNDKEIVDYIAAKLWEQQKREWGMA